MQSKEQELQTAKKELQANKKELQSKEKQVANLQVTYFTCFLLSCMPAVSSGLRISALTL